MDEGTRTAPADARRPASQGRTGLLRDDKAVRLESLVRNRQARVQQFDDGYDVPDVERINAVGAGTGALKCPSSIHEDDRLAAVEDDTVLQVIADGARQHAALDVAP